jgi:hypothetical protein
LAELAVRRVLHGQLPAPAYPAALREQAPKVWWSRAERTFGHARAGLRGVDDLIPAAGPDPAVLRDLVDGSRSLCSDALRAIYTL